MPGATSPRGGRRGGGGSRLSHAQEGRAEQRQPPREGGRERRAGRDCRRRRRPQQQQQHRATEREDEAWLCLPFAGSPPLACSVRRGAARLRAVPGSVLPSASLAATASLAPWRAPPAAAAALHSVLRAAAAAAAPSPPPSSARTRARAASGRRHRLGQATGFGGCSCSRAAGASAAVAAAAFRFGAPSRSCAVPPPSSSPPNTAPTGARAGLAFPFSSPERGSGATSSPAAAAGSRPATKATIPAGSEPCAVPSRQTEGAAAAGEALGKPGSEAAGGEGSTYSLAPTRGEGAPDGFCLSCLTVAQGGRPALDGGLRRNLHCASREPVSKPSSLSESSPLQLVLLTRTVGRPLCLSPLALGLLFSSAPFWRWSITSLPTVSLARPLSASLWTFHPLYSVGSSLGLQGGNELSPFQEILPDIRTLVG